MVVTEESVGIVSFRSSHTGFQAVVKQRYQDFVVHEISKYGTVVDITDGGEEYLKPEGRKRSRDDTHEDNVREISAEQLSGGLEELKDDVGDEELAKRIKDFVTAAASEEQAEGEGTKNDKSNVQCLLYPMQDKSQRTLVHRWCARYLPSYITDTIMEGATSEGGCSIGNTEKKRLLRIRPRGRLRLWRRTGQSKRQRLNNNQGSTQEIDAKEGKAKASSAEVGIMSDSTEHDTYDPRQNRDQKDRVLSSTYVSFVLRKENADTTDAITSICRILRLRKSLMSYAGTKDKRAVTFQQMRIRGVSPSRLHGLHKALRRGRLQLRIGNVAICDKEDNVPLKLGDLMGNKFTLCLRNLSLLSDNEMNGQYAGANDGTVSESNFKELKSVVLNAVDSVRKRGFVNYFGLQRFGSGASPTHETGYAVLANKFEQACKLILQPCQYEHTKKSTAVTGILKQFQEKTTDARTALEKLPKFMNIERRILESYARNERDGVKHDHRAAFCALPVNLRKMYAHAVQSYLWNIMANIRISVSSTSYAIAEDIVPRDDSILENRQSEKLLALLETRAVTAEEEKNESVSIYRVILPIAGKGINLDKIGGRWGEVCRDEIRKRKLDFETSPTELGLMGGWRRLIARPRDIDVRLTKYSRWDDDLIRKVGAESAKESQGRSTEERKMGAILSFSLGTAEYATMCVRELTKMDSSIASQIRMQAGDIGVKEHEQTSYSEKIA